MPLALALLTCAGPALAQEWPTKPVRVIVPFPPGGGTDTVARPLTAKLSQLAGQQFVIDNRGGAGGNLGAGIAARAPKDGYTYFMGAVHHAIAPSVYKKLDYSLTKDFEPLVVVAVACLLIGVGLTAAVIMLTQ